MLRSHLMSTHVYLMILVKKLQVQCFIQIITLINTDIAIVHLILVDSSFIFTQEPRAV